MSFPVALWDNIYSARGSQKLVFAHVKIHSICSWIQLQLCTSVCLFFKMWTHTLNSALQFFCFIIYLFLCINSEVGKHMWGWCWNASVWFQIRPQEMSEGCFWVRADEDQYAKPDLLNRVAVTFCTQRTGESPDIFILYIAFNKDIGDSAVHRCYNLNLYHKPLSRRGGFLSTRKVV